MAPPRRLSGAGVAVVAVIMAAALLMSMAYALTVGSASVSVPTVLEVVGRRLGLGDFEVTRFDDRIVWRMRAPRVVGAAAVGAGLAVAGAVLQSLTRNDLADPYLLGISSGATLGAITVIILGVSVAGLVGTAMIAAGAFVGALTALLLVLTVAAGRSGILTPARTVLAGVAIGQICGALGSFIVIYFGDSHSTREVVRWTLGTMAALRWHTTTVVLVTAVLAVILVMFFASDLDAFAFGEASASSLGVSVSAVRWILMVGTALLTACLVAFVGAIGFVGLVVPHVIRIIFGPLHRTLLPLSALLGAILLVWADTLARSAVESREIPIGIVTACVGAPVFAYLLWRGSKAG